MANSLWIRHWISIALCALLAACGGGGSGGSDSINGVQSVNVTNNNLAGLAAGDTRQLTASVTFDDGSTADVSGNVVWSTPEDGGPDNARVVSINNNGLLRALRAGTTTLTATLDGVSSQPISITIAEARLESIAISATGLLQESGPRTVFENTSGVSFTANGRFSDGTERPLNAATFTSNNGAVSFTNSSSGNASINSVTSDQSVTVRATQGSIFGTFALTVLNDEVTSIEIRQQGQNTELSQLNIASNEMRQLSAIATTESNRTSDITNSATWTSSNGDVASVAAGLVTGGDQGSAIIMASQDGVSDTVDVQVTAALQSIRIALVSPAEPTITAGVDGSDTARLQAIGQFSDNQERPVDVNWSIASDDTQQLTIITDPATAQQQIDVRGDQRTADGDPAQVQATASGFNANFGLTVTAELQSITVTPGTESVIAGVDGSDQQQFQAFGQFSDSDTADSTPLDGVTWSLDPSDTDQASIDANGLATGLKRTGDTPVTVVASKGDATPGNASLTVTADLVSIRIDPDSDPVNSPVGIAMLFKAFGTFSDGAAEERLNDVTWALEMVSPAADSVDSTVVTADDADTGAQQGDFLVTGNVEGASADVIASRGNISSDTDKPAVMFVTTAAVVNRITIVPPGANPADPFELPVDGDDQFRAFASFSDGSNEIDVTNDVEWASFDPDTNSSTASIAAVGNTAAEGNSNGNKGLVLGIEESSSLANIMATFSNPDGSTPATVSGSYKVRVIDAEPFFIEITRSPTADNPDVAVGFDLQFTATGFFAGSTEPRDVTDEVTWSITVADTIATIDNAENPGLLTAQGVSTGNFSENVIVIATLDTNDGSVTATSSAVVRDATLQSISVESSRGITQLPIGETEQYRAIGTFMPNIASGDANFTMDLTKQTTWSAPAAATPNGTEGAASVGNVNDGTAGLVRGEQAGDASITASCGAPDEAPGTRCADPLGQRISGASTLTITDAVVVALCIYLPEDGPCDNGPLPAGQSPSPVAFSLPLGRDRQVAVAALFSDDSVDNNYQNSPNLEFRFENCSIAGGDATDCDVASENNGNISADAVGEASIRAVATAAGTDSMSEVNSRETVELTVTAAVLEQLCIEPVGADPDNNCAADGYTSVNRSLPNGLSTTRYRARVQFSDGSTAIVTNSSQPEYASGTEGIFTVGRNNGLITFAEPTSADSVGEVVTITASFTDSNNDNQVTTATADVTITAADLASVAITSPLEGAVIPVTFSGATQIRATATFTDSSTQDVTAQSSWSSADSNIVFVNSQGVATRTNGASGDTVDITVAYSFNGMSADATNSAEVQAPQIRSYRVLAEGDADRTVAVGDMITFEAFAVREDGNVDANAATDVEWSIVQVDGDATIDAATGEATGTAEGDVRVVAAGPQRSNGSRATGQATLTVTSAP